MNEIMATTNQTPIEVALGIDEDGMTTARKLYFWLYKDGTHYSSWVKENVTENPFAEENIFPFQESADVMFNSALIYELVLIKQFAEPLLFCVPKDAPEYVEAKRLLKFLDYFLGADCENVPKNSIIREFIGGSCFKV